MNKNASLDHSVPCSLPLTLSIYSIVKRCYVFDQAAQILCRFPHKGRVFLLKMPGNFQERIVIREEWGKWGKWGVIECHHL